MRTITVNANDSNQRIDKFLQKYLKNAPKSLIYKYIRKKRIKVNKKRVDIDYQLVENDIIDLYINEDLFQETDVPQDQDFKTLTSDIDVIYEDNNILLVDKKPGMLVHSAKPDNIDDLTNHIKNFLYKKGEYIPEEENSFGPAVCNRLDRNTGGIVIAAKNAQTLRIINEKIRLKEVKRYYLCIVHGTMKEKQGQLIAYITKNRTLNKMYISDTPKSNYQQVITKYKVLKEQDNMSLLEIELITGRTHQIRAHFSHIGHPIVGDVKYGKKVFHNKIKFKYQALYSYKITFDFTDAGMLNYLTGRTFKTKNINSFKSFFM